MLNGQTDARAELCNKAKFHLNFWVVFAITLTLNVASAHLI